MSWHVVDEAEIVVYDCAVLKCVAFYVGPCPFVVTAQLSAQKDSFSTEGETAKAAVVCDLISVSCFHALQVLSSELPSVALG